MDRSFTAGGIQGRRSVVLSGLLRRVFSHRRLFPWIILVCSLGLNVVFLLDHSLSPLFIAKDPTIPSLPAVLSHANNSITTSMPPRSFPVFTDISTSSTGPTLGTADSSIQDRSELPRKGDLRNPQHADVFRNSSVSLQDQRFGNIPLSRSEKDHAFRLIASPPHPLPQHVFQDLWKDTLCWENSVWTEPPSFTILTAGVHFSNQELYQNQNNNSSKAGKDQADSISIKLWTTRLVYLGVHWHQMVHANLWDWTEDATTNTASNEYTPNLKYNNHSNYTIFEEVGSYDFECPNTQFLVVSLSELGIGTNIRLGVAVALKAALAMGRVGIILNNLPSSMRRLAKELTLPWPLVSCDRGDYQCFFWPLTPCVLTEMDLRTAYRLSRLERRHFFRHGTSNASFHQERVVYMPLTFRAQRHPPRLQTELFRVIQQYILPRLPKQWQSDPQVRRAIERLIQPVDAGGRLDFVGDVEITNALVLYSLRPLPQHRQNIDHQVARLTRPLNFHQTAGLPIRASDKCTAESECPPFSTYIRALTYSWTELLERDTSLQDNNRAMNVLVTTESQQVLQEQQEFGKTVSSTRTELGWDITFINNPRDVTQGTGFVRGLTDVNQTDVLTSSLAALYLQLFTRLITANCCSNFHQLLGILAQSGCGRYDIADFVCLQQHPLPEARIRCSWKRKKYSNPHEGSYDSATIINSTIQVVTGST